MPLVGLDDFGVERCRQLDVKIEQAWPVLVADREGVAEARGRNEGGRHAAALEERVGRDGRTDADDVDPRFSLAFPGEQGKDAGDARIGCGAILRQALFDVEISIGRAADDVGERTAPVDPELPAAPLAHAAQDNLSAP